MEDWIAKHSAKLDEIAQDHDSLGTLQGVVPRSVHNGAGRRLDMVDLVFDHGIVQVTHRHCNLPSEPCLMTRIDGG
jgi:hypothetical protein